MLSVQNCFGDVLGCRGEVNWRTNVIRGLMTNRLDSVRAFKWLDGAADNGAEHWAPGLSQKLCSLLRLMWCCIVLYLLR